MSKVNFSTLKLKPSSEVKKITIKNKAVEVKQYLPIEDKFDLINITLQKSEINGVYDSLLLDVFLKLNLIYLYTDFVFTEEMREDEFKLYDILHSNGIIDAVIFAIPVEEYNFIKDMIYSNVKNYNSYNTSFAGVMKSLIQDLPVNAEAAAKMVESFDKEKYQEVVSFAKAIGQN